MAFRILRLGRVDLRIDPRTWDFAVSRRAEIEAHFAAAKAAKPELWNGRMLLTGAHAVADGTLSGTCFETDFASFLAWRDWGFPDPTVCNVFAQAVVQAGDGAQLLGIMGPHTANAGRIYFPSGTLEPADVVDGHVDVDANLMRELAEETGLTAADVTPEADWTALVDGPRIALMRVVRSAEPAERLKARILDHVAADDHPELSGIHVARSPADIDPHMPAFVAAYLRHVWSARGS